MWFQTITRSCQQTEALLQISNGTRSHPIGVLPPNGATVYGIHDINGYDSLSLRGYRLVVSSSETDGNPSPLLNGNMILLQTPSPTLLDSLGVRWVVTLEGAPAPVNARPVLTADGCTIYERALPASGVRVGGEAFSPSFREGKYAPETFRLGVFVSLLALGLWSALWVGSGRVRVYPKV